ncbi:887_t:CDS:2 [Ambispora leptoticha]|uniref:887_t:CDS:1 n=1 Tax=Ambispora leptoticha TaxID=144679 RepID=A0A9N9GWN3_9GLOM|nr:887_t:CDS:2 [Ambispora leptoticha]
MADYVFQERGISISQQTVSRILKEQGVTYKTLTYHYQQIVSQQEINYFIDRTRNLPPYQLLALDECGFHLNEDPRRGYSLKGTRAISQRPSSKGEHYTLLLCIGNTEKDGVVHYQLIKDNARIHHAKKKCIDLGLLPIKELLISRNIQPVYFPPYTPQLNPTELCFNFIRNYIERRRPRTFEELKSLIDEAMEELNKKDLREYFKHC